MLSQNRQGGARRTSGQLILAFSNQHTPLATDRFRESSDGGDCCTANKTVAILENHSQKTATVYSHGDEFREHDGQSAGRLLTLQKSH